MEKFFDDSNSGNDHFDSTTAASFPPPYVSEPKGYALSGKIMLSAIIILFAVVVIMVCLHIYARWYVLRARRRNVRRARRRTHLVFYIDPSDPSNIAPVHTSGLDASLLKSLPTFVYSNDPTDANNKGGSGGGGDGGEVLECAVCLCEFEEGEKGRMLPKCNHSFHVECIDMWFHSHDTCPICRAPVEAADLTLQESGPAEVVVELSELTRGQMAQSAEWKTEVGPSLASEGPSSSLGGRRKGLEFVGVTVEVPRRCQSFSFTNSDESGSSRSPSHGFKSPTCRIRSLKRILSRERRSPLPSPSGAGTSRAEFDVESGRVDPATTPSHCLTPR